MLDINYVVYFGDKTKLDNINVCVWIKRCLGEHYWKITNPRVPGAKAWPTQPFYFPRSIKQVPGAPGDLVVKSILSP